jgi:D-glycero-alpha-D-manno-heptose 1-phosphate guanylyltransferase
MTPERIHPVILAGGLGTRLRRVLPDLPKPLAPAAGRPFLEWVVRWLARAGFRRVTVSTGYRADLIAEHFGTGPVPGVEVGCVAEERQMGTAGGFRWAARACGDRPDAWLVLNGDSLICADPLALAEPLRAGADAALLGRRLPDTGRFGRLSTDDNGRLLAFAEKTGGPGLVNAGVYLIRAGLLDRMGEQEPLSFEYDVFPGWLRAGLNLAVCPSDAPFLDVGTEDSLAQADDFIQSNREVFA